MKKSTSGKVWLAVVGLPLLAGCVVYKRQPPVAEAPPASSAIMVNTAPPSPQVEVIPACPGPVD